MVTLASSTRDAAPRSVPDAGRPEDDDRPARPVSRIHIIGGPGAGKTTLARQLAEVTGLPVHHLDAVARVGGGTGRVRSPDERDPLVAAILATDGAITEGVHLGWTEPILARADLVIWLDPPSGGAAARRVADRFMADAWAAFRRRTWRERLAAVPGYVRHARDLVAAMLEARGYGRAGAPAGVTGTAPDPSDLRSTRAATEAALAPHAGRLIVVRSHAAAEALVADIAAGRRPRPAEVAQPC